MKRIILLLASVLLLFQTSSACSMYKVTRDGKTIVGNNEDWYSPNTQIWFTPGEGEEYGIMNVGFINGFPQGGINEAGLMFDGFAMPHLAVNNTEGKIKLPLDQVMAHIMHTYATVEPIKEYLLTMDLSDLATGMIVFVDKKGDYLIVEGDELIIGQEAEQIFSNFYPSQTLSNEEVPIHFYRNGLAYINNSEAESSTAYCSSVMNKMKQDITQYSTIYDLEKLTIRIYHFQNFEHYKEINLKEELKKGKHKLHIPEFFPENTEGQEYYRMYNDTENPALLFETMMKRTGSQLTGDALERFKESLAFPINQAGYEWLNHKNNAKGAIAIFQYGTKLLPHNANLFDSLGEAFFRNKNYSAAIKNYKKSLALDPNNKNAVQMLQAIKEEQELKE